MPENKQQAEAYPLWLGQLLHGLLQVGQGTLNQALVLLEVVEQHVPEGLPAEDLGVPQDDQAILGTSQGNIEPPGVTEKADAL